MKTNCEHVWDKGAENTLVDTSAEESPHMMLFCYDCLLVDFFLLHQDIFGIVV